MEGLLAFGTVLALYLVPAMVAKSREHRNTPAIVALNLLLGWTVLGWIASLVWAFTDNCRPAAARAQVEYAWALCEFCGVKIEASARKCPACGMMRA